MELSNFLAQQHLYNREKLRQEDMLLNDKEFGFNKALLRHVGGLKQVTQNLTEFVPGSQRTLGESKKRNPDTGQNIFGK